jgi:hypothetical protein
MKKLRHIFAIAAAAFAMAVTPAEALERGDVGTPKAIQSHIVAEGHTIAAMYNQFMITNDDKAEYYRNVITSNENGDWYLILGDAELGVPATEMQVELKGTDLTFYKPDFEQDAFPLIPVKENYDYIRKLRDDGRKGVFPRSFLLEEIMTNKTKNYYAASGVVRTEDNKIMGFIDIIASKIGDTDEKAIGLIFTDTGGASYIAKNGRALQVLDATKEKFVDLREKKALSNFRPIKN